MAKKPKKEEFDLEVAMLGATGGKASKSKSKIPVHEVPELEYIDEITKEKKNFISDWMNAQSAMKTAESTKKACEQNIFPIAQQLRIGDCRETNTFLNSIKVCIEPNTLTFTQKSQFSDIDQEHKTRIQDVCEDENVDYDEYFEPFPVVSLNEDLTKEQKSTIIKKLFEVFGSEFPHLFDLKYPIRVKAEKFARDLVFKASVGAVFSKLGPENENIVTMYKPSLKKD